jgi:hypothetical protein
MVLGLILVLLLPGQVLGLVLGLVLVLLLPGRVEVRGLLEVHIRWVAVLLGRPGHLGKPIGAVRPAAVGPSTLWAMTYSKQLHRSGVSSCCC